jgi:isoleucyl-tRNA synthetase
VASKEKLAGIVWITALYVQVLHIGSVVMAAFTPFLAEEIHVNLVHALPESDPRRVPSVHLCDFPDASDLPRDAAIIRAVGRMQAVIELGRKCRDQASLSVKQPLREIVVCTQSAEAAADIQSLEEYVRAELNVRSVRYDNDGAAYGINFSMPEPAPLLFPGRCMTAAGDRPCPTAPECARIRAG